jgi:hypothetical protein
MIQPNKLKQAQQELATISFNNGFEIPEEINEKEAKYYYACIGVKAKDSKDGFTKLYEGALLWANVNKWMKMKRQIKEGVFKREFGNMYDKIVILHDPTIKPKATPKATPKTKDLSPTQKKKVNALVEEGLTVEGIAEQLNLDIKRIKAYLNA